MTTLEKGLADLKSIQDGSAHAIGRAAGVTNLVRDTEDSVVQANVEVEDLHGESSERVVNVTTRPSQQEVSARPGVKKQGARPKKAPRAIQVARLRKLRCLQDRVHVNVHYYVVNFIQNYAMFPSPHQVSLN